MKVNKGDTRSLDCVSKNEDNWGCSVAYRSQA